jgi:hypothetical protein
MMSNICRTCGCTEHQALEDATTLGFQGEFQNGTYTCCQIVAWADEQWLAWAEAAEQDGTPVEEATKPLEAVHQKKMLVRVSARRAQNPQFGGRAASDLR